MSGFNRLEIKSGVLDFGTAFVRLEHVASVYRGERRPLRGLGIALIAAALLVLGFEAVFNLMSFFSFKGSVRIWAACGLAGVGIFSLVYAQRCLFIETTGGEKLTLRIPDSEFTQRVIDELRRAMTAAPGHSAHVIADIAARTIEAGDAVGAHANHPAGSPHTAPGAHQPLPHAQPHMSPRHTEHFDGPHAGPAATGGASTAYRQSPANQINGHAPAVQQPAYGPSLGAPPQGAQPHGGYNGAPHFNGQPGAPVFRAEPPMRTGPPTGTRELGQLIEFVARSQIQHKDALLELLKVVEDHQIGGRTPRDDALAHWKSFSDYVAQYLNNVEGLPQMTERAGRSLPR